MTNTIALTVALTLPGFGGGVQTLTYQTDNEPGYQAAFHLDGAISSSVRGGSLVVALPGDATTIPAGSAGLLQVGVGGQYTIAAGYLALIDTASTAATVFGGNSDGQLVIAGSGGLAFNAGLGAGTVLAGDANNYVSVLRGSGAQYIATGIGDDTIIAVSANNTIWSGAGNNFILGQGGNDLIYSMGNDLIWCPDGNPTIILCTPREPGASAIQARTVFLGNGAAQIFDTAASLFGLQSSTPNRSVIVVGSAAATINSQAADQIWMQDGGGLVQSTGVYLKAASGGGQTPSVATVTSYSADTVIGGTGAITVNASRANDFVFAGTGALQFTGGLGASTILGNAGGTASITGGAGSVVAIAYGQTQFTGGAGAATVAAFGGSVTINGGSGTGLFIGAAGGGNRITAGTGNTTIYGGGAGDVLAAGSMGGGILVAGGGAETLIGGAGADLFAAMSGTAGTLVVQNFTPGQDFFTLVGFGAGAAATALAGAVVVGGSEQLTLSDGTRILFAGVTGLAGSSFI